jgi:hypothetical protein
LHTESLKPYSPLKDSISSDENSVNGSDKSDLINLRFKQVSVYSEDGDGGEAISRQPEPCHVIDNKVNLFLSQENSVLDPSEGPAEADESEVPDEDCSVDCKTLSRCFRDFPIRDPSKSKL